jgi:hypothetical protein
MGHTEMLLAVAGLDSAGIEQRTSQLASGDWSTFPAGDRTAFAFARKQSKAPWSINDADVQRLVDHFGTERTIDVLWWAARCHYMTRVADAFQLPLEKEIVFQPLPSKEAASNSSK